MKPLSYKSIQNRFQRLASGFTEKTRRQWAAAEAIELGHGGVMAVSRATGLMPRTIRCGIKELGAQQGDIPPADKQRKAGGGRKKLVHKEPRLLAALEQLIAPYTSGDPMRPLRWTCKSTSNLADALGLQGFSISASSVGSILKKQGYSLQGNRKRFEGKQSPDRDLQFEYIANISDQFLGRQCPVISVDAKKKELIGNYANAGQEWRKKEEPLEVEAYDFINPELGKVTPYGVYDLNLNTGWVNVGTDNDTAQFAVESIKRWWEEMGEWAYPKAREILILADGGGSNGSRNRLWKKSLQEWADKERLTVMVCHFPPGTSKWNKIEHRMFCHITRNWRGQPLVSHEVVIELIGSTTTKAGLKIKANLDKRTYPKGIKVTDEEMSQLSIERADFHGEWNYFIKPSK
jgi:hypothetical protein